MQVPVLIIVLVLNADYLGPIVRSILGIHVPKPNILGKLLFCRADISSFIRESSFL